MPSYSNEEQLQMCLRVSGFNTKVSLHQQVKNFKESHGLPIDITIDLRTALLLEAYAQGFENAINLAAEAPLFKKLALSLGMSRENWKTAEEFCMTGGKVRGAIEVCIGAALHATA